MPDFDFESRRIVEALRSGVPSRAIGHYFSQARPKIMGEIAGKMDKVIVTGQSAGMVITGKYGEGKTHLLNSVFNMAQERNMVVSFLSVSKETPLSNFPLLYQKLMANTYLPGESEPGISKDLEKLTPNSPVGSEMLVYSAKNLETDKLYYLLRSYMGTEDAEERFQLETDLMGDFIIPGTLKKIYKRIFMETAKYNVNFSKTKHTGDYFSFMSHLFLSLGYSGWVILVDEVELTGRLGKKARLNAYKNIAYFLNPPESLQSVFTLFALSASYGEDVIEGKHDFDNLVEIFPDNPEPIRSVLHALLDAPQLLPLTRGEMLDVMEKVMDFHGRSYNWYPECTPEQLLAASANSGYLLRTKLRTAIEYLDQLYQYGSFGQNTVTELSQEDYTEEDTVSLDSLDSDSFLSDS